MKGGELKMRLKTILAGITVLALGIVLMAPKAVDAYQGDPGVRGPYYTEERHEAMEKAFETNDYTAWKNLMQGRGRLMQIISRDNFAKFAKAHELAEQGKIDEANKIRAELGLGLGQRNHAGRSWSN